jgi:molybdate transport system substrate-binding protein
MRLAKTLAALALTFSVGAHAQITAAVAANMQFAFEDIRAEFKKATGIEVKAVYGASGKLSTQIRSGAPFDAFISADVDYPDSLWKNKHAATAPRVYASGLLVLWTTKDLDLSKGLELVKDPSVRKIGIGDPKVTVYGPAAIESLKKLGLWDEAQPKVVYGQNISQVGQYVVTGAVDLGFAPLSIAGAPANKGKGKFIAVDHKLYENLPQAAVVTKFGQENNPGSSRKLIDFLLGPKSREILARYGYNLP